MSSFTLLSISKGINDSRALTNFIYFQVFEEGIADLGKRKNGLYDPSY